MQSICRRRSIRGVYGYYFFLNSGCRVVRKETTPFGGENGERIVPGAGSIGHEFYSCVTKVVRRSRSPERRPIGQVRIRGYAFAFTGRRSVFYVFVTTSKDRSLVLVRGEKNEGFEIRRTRDGALIGNVDESSLWSKPDPRSTRFEFSPKNRFLSVHDHGEAAILDLRDIPAILDINGIKVPRVPLRMLKVEKLTGVQFTEEDEAIGVTPTELLRFVPNR